MLLDMQNNSQNPARPRSKVPWRKNASEAYENEFMMFQNPNADYNEHKISGKIFNEKKNKL